MANPTLLEPSTNFVSHASEAQVVATLPNCWVEKTYVDGVDHREVGDYALGMVLWSPKENKKGQDIYSAMRKVEPGDIILHLVNNEEFVGVSRAKTTAEDFDGVSGSHWREDETSERSCYLVELEDYQPLVPPLHRSVFFSSPFNEELLRLKKDGLKNLFFTKDLQLRQGAYLTPAPAALVSVLNNAYYSVAGRSIVEIAKEEDRQSASSSNEHSSGSSINNQSASLLEEPSQDTQRPRIPLIKQESSDIPEKDEKELDALRDAGVVSGNSSQRTEEYVDYKARPLEEVITSVSDKGLLLDKHVIRQYYLLLDGAPPTERRRKFIILSGMSGTGKTWLTEVYKEIVRAKYLKVPVSPSWSMDEALLGCDDFRSGGYRETECSRFLTEAALEYENALKWGITPRPYHLVLDEMNLAYTEHYFAKLLSAMEVCARDGVETLELGANKRVKIYPNLCFVGTINVDATTKSISDKVYDRAQVIEIPLSRSNIIKHIGAGPYSALLGQIWDALQGVVPFSHRVVDEIKGYMGDAERHGVSMGEAFDDQIILKILPKCEQNMNFKTHRLLVRALRELEALLPEDNYPRSFTKVRKLISKFDG